MAAPLPMPIRLSAAGVAASPTAQRMVFVLGEPENDAQLDVFGRGLFAVLGNYLTARPVGGGLAALCDDETFLAATRALADTIYLAAGVTVDRSAANADAPHVIAGVYPDATFVVVGEPDAALDAKLQLLDPARVVRVGRGELDAVVAGLDDPPSPAPTPLVDAALVAPVFVVGCPRSGTTWVQNLLSAHPGLAGPSAETAMFVAVRGLLGNDVVAHAVGRDTLVAAVRRFLTILASACLGDTGARFLEKTPIHGLHLELLTEVFPDAFVVGVHRDGRDVVRSLLEVDAGADDAASAAAFWTEITRAVHRFAQVSPRARDERYEDWLANPVVGAVEVLTWLGLPPDDRVIEELRARAPRRVSQYNTTGAVGEGKWLDMSERDLRAVYRVAGDCLAEMGYAAPVTARPNPIARFRRSMRRR